MYLITHLKITKLNSTKSKLLTGDADRRGEVRGERPLALCRLIIGTGDDLVWGGGG
jgi:hypothetical protein